MAKIILVSAPASGIKNIMPHIDMQVFSVFKNANPYQYYPSPNIYYGCVYPAGDLQTNEYVVVPVQRIQPEPEPVDPLEAYGAWTIKPGEEGLEKQTREQRKSIFTDQEIEKRFWSKSQITEYVENNLKYDVVFQRHHSGLAWTALFGNHYEKDQFIHWFVSQELGHWFILPENNKIKDWLKENIPQYESRERYLIQDGKIVFRFDKDRIHYILRWIGNEDDEIPF